MTIQYQQIRYHVVLCRLGYDIHYPNYYIPLIQNDIKSDKSFFDEYSDFLIYENHSLAFLQFLEFLESKRLIQQVNNLLYIKNDKIIENEYSLDTPNSYYVQDFEYVKDNQYLFPELFLPINITDGCYWGKCIFCALFSPEYKVRNIDYVIEEIKYYQQKYKTNYFFLRDLSFAPSVADEFSEKLIKNKINIRYATFCRFENEFDYKLLKKLYKSGLRCLNWGLESGSQKILDYTNKGINLGIASRIIKDCYNIGIGNKINAMYGIPNETYEDFCETIDFIIKHKKYIFYATVHSFFLKRYSYIFNHLEDYNIKLKTNKFKWEYSPNEFLNKYNIEMYQNKIKLLKNINKVT